MTTKTLKFAAALFILIFAAFALIAPLISLFFRMGDFSEVPFFSPSVLGPLKVSAIQATLSSLGAVVAGLLLALAIHSFTNQYLHRLFIRILSVSYALPTLVIVNFWIFIFAASHRLPFGISFSLDAVILAHALLNAPWAAALLLETRMRVPIDQIETARLLGARPRSIFRWILWPYLKVPFLSVFSQIFLLCVMSFSIVLILGGGPPVESLETGIYQSLRYGLSNSNQALAFGFWQLLLCALPWIFILALSQNSKSRLLESAPQASPGKRKPIASFLFLGLSFSLSFIYFIPFIFGLSLKALEDGSLLTDLRASALESFRIAAFTSLLVLIVSIPWIFSLQAFKTQSSRLLYRLLAALTTLPGALSPLVLSLSIWLLWPPQSNARVPSYVWVSLIIGIQSLPLAFRVLWPLAEQMRLDLMEAARTLGASPIKAFYYGDFFRWKYPVLFLAAMSFSVAFGELGAVSSFMTESDLPLSLLMRRLMSQYRFEEAAWVALLLALVSVIAIFSTWFFEKTKRTTSE